MSRKTIKYPCLTLNKTYKQLSILIIIITTIFPATITNQNPNYQNKNYKRILEIQNKKFVSNSIYYVTKFPKNNISGTGDKLNDIPYRAICLLKNCNSGCCVGEINFMTCGLEINCTAYKDHEFNLVAAPAAIIPICVLFFLFVFILIFTKRNKYSFCKSVLLAVICLGVITIPFVLYYTRNAAPKKNKKKVEKK